MKTRNILLFVMLGLLTFSCGGHLKEARTAWSQNDYHQAITLCQKAVAVDSTDAQAYFLLGKSYHALDSLHLALKATKRAHLLDSQSSEIRNAYARTHTHLGDRALSRKNTRKALSHYTSAETLLPNDPQIILRIADLNYQLGWLDKARAKYGDFVQVTSDPTRVSKKLSKIDNRTEKARSLHQQGQNTLKKGRLKTAKSLLARALKEKPDAPDIRYHLHLAQGRLFFERGSQKALWDAIEAFGKAASLHPEAAEPHFRMAQVYEKKDSHEFTNAIDEYEIALRIEPEGPFAKTCKEKIRKLKKRKDKLDRFWGREK